MACECLVILTMGKSYQLKRSRPENFSDSDESSSTKPNVFDAFLLIESLDEKSFNKVSPFVIEKALYGAIGNVISCKVLKDGKLLVQVETAKKSVNLKKLDTFCDLKVKVYAHKTLNSSKGIIRDRRLFVCTEAGIQQNLSSQGVTHVRRIRIKKGNDFTPTNTFVLTFNTPSRPEHLKIFFEKIPVTPYIPNPLRCFQCQKFGHHENNCKNHPVCAKCSEKTPHHEDLCTGQVKCANCSEAHRASSNQCSVWKREKEITRVRFTNNVSYHEARRIVENIPVQTYSNIVKSALSTKKDASTQTCTVGTQTDNSSEFQSESTPVNTVNVHKPSGTPAPKSGKHSTPSVPKSGKPAPEDGKNSASTSLAGEAQNVGEPTPETGKNSKRKDELATIPPKKLPRYSPSGDTVTLKNTYSPLEDSMDIESSDRPPGSSSADGPNADVKLK